ncbi:MAG TPA: PAS domain-containing protein [Longimicrobiaceae bacterium]|jgi:PAS domain S-box-containing protein|nr:PAS domain-containing protein [Longimicrobiaceae bacterium]
MIEKVHQAVPAEQRVEHPLGDDPLFGGPGEMRALCRAFDWAATPLGPSRSWPQTLRTTAGIVLASRNPMFLWWGPELIQLYNDAYRPSLGEDGRHPRGLGMPGREFWTDIWETIGPQIGQVMSGGPATWHEDQYLPIQRNGRLEDVWWTYSYSAVHDEDGGVAGTLVVCQETTQRVLGERERDRLRAETARAERLAARILERVADEHLTMDSQFRILTLNAAAERALGVTRGQMCGKTHWEAFPASVGTVVEETYRRVAAEGTEAHVTHHYLGEGYDRHLEIDAYPTGEGGVAVFWRDVSARVHAERALEESAARLRATYDGTYEYIGLISPDGTVMDCNRASLAFADMEREDVVGRPLWETPWFTHTPGAPELLRGWVAQAAAGEFVRHEAALRRPGGEVLVFDFSLHPVRDERGRVVLIVPEGRDITERQRSEAALRASESRYHTLFESLDEGFCVLEVIFDGGGRPVDYRFIEANPAFVAQTGLTDAVGRRVREMVPDQEAFWYETYGRVVLTGEATRFEAPAQALGRFFDVYAFRIGEPGEHRVAVLFKDVSAARKAAAERERLLEALEVERARLREVFRRAPSFIVAFRGQGHVYDFVNEAYYQLVGHREIIGKPLLDAIPEIRGQGFDAILDRVLETGEPWVGRETPVLLQRTPGAPLEPRYLDMVFQPLAEADGTRSGVVVHGSDITAQVLARRDVERLLEVSERARADAEAARAEAEAANRAKGEFLAVMSHELRTPLNAIGGYAELMEMGIRGAVTPQQAEDLRRIQQSQRHLLGLINEVLNYAKLETGTVHFEVEDVRIGEALAAAESLVAPQARAKGLALVVEAPAPMLAARADPEKLRQVLVNLLSNAVKFTDAGGRVEMSAGREGDRVCVTVADSGIGIPADKLDAIFDPFVQVRADLTRPHEGTGLGLAISRDLARGMGGELSAQSRPGEGSTFTLRLPAASIT